MFEQSPKNELETITHPEGKIKDGVDFVFEQNIELSEIGTKEQYSQYLDSIFPNSKIKEIVYHSTSTLFENYDIDKGDLGMHFSPKNVSSGILYSQYTKANIINIKNPLYFTDFGGFHFRMFGKKFVEANIINHDEFSVIDNMNLSVKEEDKLLRELILSRGYDGIIYLNRREGINGGILNSDDFYKDKNLNDIQFKEKYPDASDSYIALNSEQIYILGSKKDIEEFKKFVTQT